MWKLLESKRNQAQRNNLYSFERSNCITTDGNYKKSYLPRCFPCSFNIGNEITVERALRLYIFQMSRSLSFFIYLPRHNAFSTVSNSINEERDMQINSCYKNNNVIQQTWVEDKIWLKTNHFQKIRRTSSVKWVTNNNNSFILWWKWTKIKCRHISYGTNSSYIV